MFDFLKGFRQYAVILIALILVAFGLTDAPITELDWQPLALAFAGAIQSILSAWSALRPAPAAGTEASRQLKASKRALDIR